MTKCPLKRSVRLQEARCPLARGSKPQQNTIGGRLSGFYLGYLRGRRLPPPPKKKCPASTPKLLLSLQSISNYIRKTIQTRRVLCTWSKFSCLRTLYDKIVSQNAPDCISLHIHFQKCPGEACPQTPQEPHDLRPLGTSPPNEKA